MPKTTCRGKTWPRRWLTIEQVQALAITEIRSGDGQQSSLCTTHDYVGTFMTVIPKFVTATDGATFVHQGSKGAIVYGVDPADPKSRACLLAWSKSVDPLQASKVYVRAGPLEVFMQTDIWRGIENALDQATETSQDHDPISGAVITAGIVNNDDRVASVGAILGIISTNP
ncbi:hypothetical protein vseg_009657 [Gypsophila vaccaria]